MNTGQFFHIKFCSENINESLFIACRSLASDLRKEKSFWHKNIVLFCTMLYYFALCTIYLAYSQTVHSGEDFAWNLFWKSWGTLHIYIRFSGTKQSQQRAVLFHTGHYWKPSTFPLWQKEGIHLQEVCSRNPIFPCLPRVARDRSYSCRGTGCVLSHHRGWVQLDKA